MRRVIVSNLMSLDGYFVGPNGELDWFVVDEEFLDYAMKMLRAADTLLFGPATYRHMAAHWPGAPQSEMTEKMNALEKVVFSRSLRVPELEPAWSGSRLHTGEAAAEVARLVQRPGRDLLVFGSATLASSLLEAGLVDEYRVVLQPVLLGAGRPLFPDLGTRTRLRLARIKPLESGVAVLSYEPAVAV